MNKKRDKLISSTPSHLKTKNFFMNNKPPSEIEEPSTSFEERKALKKETFLELIVEAIGIVGSPRYGASYVAIKKWIIGEKGENTTTCYHIKLALKKGIDKGILIRPQKSANAVGATGFFKLALLKPPKSSKNIATKKSVKNVPSPVRVKQMDKKTSKKPPSIHKAPKQAAVEAGPAVKTLKKNVEEKQAKKAVPQPTIRAKEKADAKHPAKNNTEKLKLPKVGNAPSAKNEKNKAAKETNKELAPSAKNKKHKAVKETNEELGEFEDELKHKDLLDSEVAKEDSFYFSDSDTGGDHINEEVSKAPKKANAKQTAKNKAIKKNNAEKLELPNVEKAISVKDKGKAVKGMKKLGNPDENSNDQMNIKPRIGKTARKKNSFTSENQLERLEFSDSEVATKKSRLLGLKARKSASSDTELEVSKREERKKKRPLRVKNISNA